MTRRDLLAPAAAVAAAVGLRTLLDSGTGPSWRRQNFRGSTVTLSAGPAVVGGLVAGVLVAGTLDRSRGQRILVAAGVSVLGAGVAGLIDDRASAREDERAVKGFTGHLGALARGKASAGTVKIAVIGSTSLVAAAIRTGASADTVIDGCLVAGCANLVNLLDLRPGRALKAVALANAALLPGSAGRYRSLLLTTTGTVAATLPADLGERTMLGDTGANALGAAVGSVMCGRSRRVRLAALAVVAGLTAVSEKVSFSRVIAGNPVLRRLDQLGGRGD
ncbi:hypothetical protein acdb102_42890 [Acidothermaceae bacterium B102]|nr:hypothetical protein acdb102_42890 [Acidothermaceae bacterium B102]